VHNDTTLLLGLADVVVDRVELDPDGTRVIHVTTADTPQACPSCATPATSVKGWVITEPCDLPFPVPTRLLWHKRRWRCQQPACPRSSFTESVPQIPARKRVTSRLRAAAGRAVALAGRTVAQAAADVGLSWPVVHAAFLDHATAQLPDEPQPVAALGIDETRRGKPRFTRDTDTGACEQVTDRWHTGFVDLTGEQGLLGQVEGRSAGDAGSWLAAQTQQWRDNVQVVAIDMCSAYRAAVRKHLPHATLVVDHFHVAQLANQMVSSVRRRVTATLRGRRVRKDDPEYGVRRRLLRNREDLTDEKFIDMWNRLLDLGPAGEHILAAWIAKEELRGLLALARTTPASPPDLPPSLDLLPMVRRHRHSRGPPSRRDHSDMVATHRGIHPHRHHQHRQRGHQPADQAGSPQRLRFPQPRQPTTTVTLHKHPGGPATSQARLTSKTR
jgi:transposase